MDRRSRRLVGWSVTPKRVSKTTSMAEFNRGYSPSGIAYHHPNCSQPKNLVDVHYPQVFKGPRDELAMLAKPTRDVLLELCATGLEVFQR
jgi:hypothetical protein